MTRSVKVCVLRIEGTNCEEETANAFRLVGAAPEMVHLKQLIHTCPKEMRRNLGDYDILVLPGGDAPEAVRKEPRALAIVREFFLKDKLVAAICHGPQTLIDAGLLKGKHATGSQAITEEMTSAGAIFEYKEVVVDGNLVTSRRPSDLPAFMREIMKAIRGKARQLKAA